MKIKKIFGQDVRQAMIEVKRSLGDEAVILANHSVPGGVEIVCALDYSPAQYEKLKEKAKDNNKMKVKLQEARGESVTWIEAPTIVSIKKEINHMRGLLENQLNGLAWQKLAQHNPSHAMIFKRLYRLGLDPELCQILIKHTPEVSDLSCYWESIIRQLYHLVKISSHDVAEKGNAIAFLGTTGSGKTSMLMKMAIRIAKSGQKEALKIISFDPATVGSREAIMAFSKLIRVPVFQAKSLENYHQLISSVTENEIALIDTPGLGQWDQRLPTLLKTLGNLRGLSNHYIIPANVQSRNIKEALKKFHKIPLAGCMLTKLDETVSLGESLSAALLHELPIAYLSDGKRIAHDYHKADKRLVIKKLIAIAKQQEFFDDEYSIAEAYTSASRQRVEGE